MYELENPRCGPKRNLQRGRLNNEGRIFDMRPKTKNKTPSLLAAKTAIKGPEALALRELETFASALLTVLLALVLPGVARQETEFL